FQVLAPALERQCVVFAQIFNMADFQTVIVNSRGNGADGGELAVGEHVPVNEGACLASDRPVTPRNAMVEEPSSVDALIVQEREICRIVFHSDMFGQTDRADGIEVAFNYITVIAVTDLGTVVEAFALDG